MTQEELQRRMQASQIIATMISNGMIPKHTLPMKTCPECGNQTFEKTTKFYSVSPLYHQFGETYDIPFNVIICKKCCREVLLDPQEEESSSGIVMTP